MKIFNIFLIEIKDFMSNMKVNIFLFLIAPFLLAYLNGTIYAKNFNSQTSLKGFQAAVINKDNGVLSKAFIDIFNNAELKKIVHMDEVSSVDNAKSKLSSSGYSAVIVIPEGFTEKAEAGKDTSIEVLQSDSSGINGEIINDIVNMYTENVNVRAGVYSSLYSNIKTDNASKIASAIMPQVTGILSRSYAKQSVVSKSNIINSKQYYSVSMLVMFSLFMIITGCIVIINAKEHDTILRLKISAVSKYSFLAGKLLSVFALSIMQIISYLLLTHFICGINWGQNLMLITLIIIIHAFTITGLTCFVCGIVNNMKTAITLLSIAIGVTSFFGGAFWNIGMTAGSLLRIATHSTVNYWLQDTYTSMMLGTSMSGYFINIIVLLCIGAVGLSVGSIFFRYEKTEVI